MDTVAVTIQAITSTTSPDGDTTVVSAGETIPGCLFEPQQATERTDPRSPGVVTPAKFYLPVPRQLDADDEIESAGTTWHVIGGSSVWGTQTEVPVRKVT